MVRRQAIRRWICEPKRKPFWAKYHSLQRRDLPHSTPVAIVQWVGDHMTQTGKPLNQTQKAALDVRILKDDELDAVSGSGQLQSAFSTVIKSIGQGLQTMASKQ
jgi:hypothetical protein